MIKFISKWLNKILFREIENSDQFKSILNEAKRDSKRIDDEIEKLKPELEKLEKRLGEKIPGKKYTYQHYYSNIFAKNFKLDRNDTDDIDKTET